MTLTIFSYPQNPRALMALVAAQYNGVEVEVSKDFKMGVDNKTQEFLAKNPVGKVPVLETPEGCIFESSAIARYVARLSDAGNLIPKDAFHASEVDQWIDFANTELSLPFAVWLYPIFGLVPYNQAANQKARADADRYLSSLNLHLRKKTFLVGERITLADIVVFAHLQRPFTMVLDPKAQAKYQNVTRWFTTLAAQKEFLAVFGKFDLCQQEKVPETLNKKDKKNDKKKNEKKAKKKKKKPEPKPAADEEETAAPKEKKTPNPLDLLPKSNFNLEEWKRVYSNKDTRSEACPWLWENFDAEGFSMWFCKYKYNSELSQLFMASNLVSGWFNRSDKVRKYGFASVLIFGKNNDAAISGVWFFRGQEVPPEMLAVDDCDLYEWVKVDLKKGDEKKLVENYLAWDGDFPEGKECADGKNFK